MLSSNHTHPISLKGAWDAQQEEDLLSAESLAASYEMKEARSLSLTCHLGVKIFAFLLETGSCLT